MRISDLSTFDSKPILLSQIDELLNNKNVTILGNSVNVVSGLVLLDDKGKIPEDADIQHIFYIDGEFPTTDIVKNSIYVSSTGEARATNNNAEYINISLKVVTDFTTVSNDTLATTQAISSFVDTKIAGIDIPSTDLSNYYNKTETDNKFALKTDIVSTDLSNYYNKTESDNKFALKTDITSSLNVTTVDNFPTSGTNNTMYIDSQNHAQVFVDGAWKDISLEVVEDFTTVDNITVPTTKAVKDLVDSAGGISSISVGDGLAGSGTTESPLKLNLSNYQTLDGINLSADSGLEVRALGTSIRLEGSGISIVMADPILSLSINNHLPNKSGGFAIVEEDTGKLPSSIIPSLDIQHIYKVTEFPTSGLVENSIYILESGEAKAYFAGGWVEISQEVETTIDTSATDDTIPTSKAVKDYVDGIAVGPAMKTEAVTKDIVFKKDVSVYKIELSAATTFTFDVSNLDEANCYTFELWVQMSTAQTLTFPSNSAWLDGTTPDMSEAGMYCFVIRKMPATMVTSTITSPQILMNLAYKYSFTLA